MGWAVCFSVKPSIQCEPSDEFLHAFWEAVTSIALKQTALAENDSSNHSESQTHLHALLPDSLCVQNEFRKPCFPGSRFTWHLYLLKIALLILSLSCCSCCSHCCCCQPCPSLLVGPVVAGPGTLAVAARILVVVGS